MEDLPITTNNRIEVLIVIDTDAIINTIARKSLKKTRPIPTNRIPQYVFCSGAAAIKSKPGEMSLAIVCNPNDVIQIRGTSIYQNATDAVIIYQIIQNGDQPFVPKSMVMKNAVQPDPDSPSFDGLPALHAEESFMSLDSKIVTPGVKNYTVCFAIYRLDADGETQNLYGYYSWNFGLSILK
jgi:hypothetical protein